jgi:hypothetical protein
MLAFNKVFYLCVCGILFLDGLFLVSCKEKKKEKIVGLINEWQGKEIKFPENPIFTRYATDTIDYYSILQSQYKVYYHL